MDHWEVMPDVGNDHRQVAYRAYLSHGLTAVHKDTGSFDDLDARQEMKNEKIQTN